VKLDVSKRNRRKNSVDWTNYSSTNYSSTSLNVETNVAPDVIAPSPWKIFGCQNGKKIQISLRFKKPMALSSF